MRGSIAAGCFPTLAMLCALPLLTTPAPLHAQGQVFTVEPEHVEKHFTEFTPTHVRYPDVPLTVMGKEELIRFMQSEQGFAMRPLPVANLVLHANGHMDPTGDKYVNLLHEKGISVKPGDRVVVSDIKVLPKAIQVDLNGGPQHKHRFLRHIQIGMDPYNMNSVVPDDGVAPTGSRITLLFEERVPDLNGQQLQALLKPMIDFGVKSPAEAYAAAMPAFLRKAIMEHRVLVGMDRDMVRFAKGDPLRKVRETDAKGKAFEVWIYGESPQPVEFVRFVGSYVTRDEIARVGEPMLVRTANEMGDYWGNQPVLANNNQREVQLGDTTDQDQQQQNAPRQAPTLRNPGEKAPAQPGVPTMGPVNFPPDQQRPGDPGYTPPAPAGNGNPQAQGQTQQQPSAPQQQNQPQNQPNPLDQPQ